MNCHGCFFVPRHACSRARLDCGALAFFLWVKALFLALTDHRTGGSSDRADGAVPRSCSVDAYGSARSSIPEAKRSASI